MEEIRLNLENLSETDRKQLLQLIEKANKPNPVSKVFKPECRDSYYLISADGEIQSFAWTAEVFDLRVAELGNVYRTRKEAERALARQKAETKYINFLRDNEPEGWVPTTANEKFYLEVDGFDSDGFVQDLFIENYVRTSPVKREFLSDDLTIQKAKNTPEIAEAWILAMGYDLPLGGV